MRYWTCLGLVVLGLAACAQIPALLRLDVDGSTLEFKKKPVEANALEDNAIEAEGDAPGR